VVGFVGRREVQVDFDGILADDSSGEPGLARWVESSRRHPQSSHVLECEAMILVSDIVICLRCLGTSGGWPGREEGGSVNLD
jgi:hypothetical protein